MSGGGLHREAGRRGMQGWRAAGTALRRGQLLNACLIGELRCMRRGSVRQMVAASSLPFGGCAAAAVLGRTTRLFICCCSAAACCGWHVAGSNYCGAGQGIEVHSRGVVWQGRASGDRMLGTGRCFSAPHVRCARLGDRCQEAWSAAAEPRRAGWRKLEGKSECVLLVLQSMY